MSAKPPKQSGGGFKVREWFVNSFIEKQLEILKEVWEKLSGSQRAIVAIVPFVLAILLWVMIVVSSRVEYVPLYERMGAEESGVIVEKLKELKMGYKLDQGNSTIMVDRDELYHIRLKLATEGLPRGDAVGYEIFDETNFGVTDFVQRLNFVRALQGELERTVSGLQEVAKARVHIVIPKEELFIEKQNPVTASVVLKVAPFKTLSRAQIKGIVHLLSSSVEGLAPKHVNIIDSHGKILSLHTDKDEDLAMSSTQMEMQNKVEKYLTNKAQSLLDLVLGEGRSIVRISAELDFDKKEVQTETYQPEGTIRSEQITKENYTGSDVTPEGVPGVASNVPGYQATSEQGKQSQMNKESNTTNYEITKRVEHLKDAVGGVARLSISVVLDGKHEMEEGELIYKPLTREQIKKFTSIVKTSVGFNESRGDQIDVQNIPFDTSMKDVQLAEMEDWEQSLLRDRAIKYGVYFVTIVMALGAILYLLRVEEVEEVMEMTPEQEAFTALMTETDTDMASERIKRERIEEEVFRLARENPDDVVKVLRVWLSTGEL